MKSLLIIVLTLVSKSLTSPQYADFYSKLESHLSGQPIATSHQNASISAQPKADDTSKSVSDNARLFPPTQKPEEFDLTNINSWDNIPAYLFTAPQNSAPQLQKEAATQKGQGSALDSAPSRVSWDYSTNRLDYGTAGGADTGNMVSGSASGGNQELFFPLADHSPGSSLADNLNQMSDWSAPPLSKDTHKYEDYTTPRPPADAESMAKAVLRGQAKRWEWTYTSTLLGGERSTALKDDSSNTVYCCRRLPYICNVDGMCVIDQKECQEFCSCASNPFTNACAKDVIPRIKKKMAALEDKLLEKVSKELNLPPPPPLFSTSPPDELTTSEVETTTLGILLNEMRMIRPVAYNRSLTTAKIMVVPTEASKHDVETTLSSSKPRLLEGSERKQQAFLMTTTTIPERTRLQINRENSTTSPISSTLPSTSGHQKETLRWWTTIAITSTPLKNTTFSEEAKQTYPPVGPLRAEMTSATQPTTVISSTAAGQLHMATMTSPTTSTTTAVSSTASSSQPPSSREASFTFLEPRPTAVRRLDVISTSSSTSEAIESHSAILDTRVSNESLVQNQTEVTLEQSSLPIISDTTTASNHQVLNITEFPNSLIQIPVLGGESAKIAPVVTTSKIVSDLDEVKQENDFLSWLMTNHSDPDHAVKGGSRDEVTTRKWDFPAGNGTADPCGAECERIGGRCVMGQDFKPYCDDTDDDPCEHFQCINGACSPTDGIYVCECREGWTGTFCEQPCNLDCGQHGTCGRVGSNMTGCVCHQNYTGQRCEEKKKIVSPVTEISLDHMKVWEVAIIAVMSAVCIALAFIVLPYFLWRRQWLPIRKLVFYFQEYEDDDDKDYDAFISYKSTPRDERFILQHLYPKLEKEMDFRLCLHFRDFSPGEPIANNIIKAIERSRRTIMVLSPSYVASEWCRMEYQKAQHEMLRLRHKIIPVVLEDISGMPEVDSNLRTIINTVTYIQWPGEEEPCSSRKVERFWKLLELSMPKRKLNLTRSHSSSCSSDVPLTTVTKSCFDSLASSLKDDDDVLSTTSLSSNASSGSGSSGINIGQGRLAHSVSNAYERGYGGSDGRNSSGSDLSSDLKAPTSNASFASSRTKQLPFEPTLTAPMAALAAHVKTLYPAPNVPQLFNPEQSLTAKLEGDQPPLLYNLKGPPYGVMQPPKYSSDDFIIKVKAFGNQIKVTSKPPRKYASELLV